MYIIMVLINLTEDKHSQVMSSFLTCLPLRVNKDGIDETVRSNTRVQAAMLVNGRDPLI